MKRLLIILISMVSVLLLVSCTETETQVVDENNIVVLNDGDKIYKDGYDGERKTLKISFTEAGFGRTWLVEIAKCFVNDYPEYEIILDGDPQLANSLATKLESGKNLSDIYFPLSCPWETYAYNGWLEPLDDVYNDKIIGEEVTTLEKMTGRYIEYATLETKDGTHYYIMPWNDTATGICYNVNMFNEYGWEIPTTTDELEELCKQILEDTDGSVKPLAYPGKIGGYFDFLVSTWWMQSAGTDKYMEFFKFESADIYNADNEIAKGKRAALEEFERFYSIDKGYTVSGSMSKDHITSQMDFINGKAAMIMNANWLETEMLTSMDDDFVMGMMRVPYLSSAKKDENGEYIKVNYVSSPDFICIPKDASNKEGAKLFLKYMNKDEMLKLYTKCSGSPRPFDYDVESIEGLSKFAKDCLAIQKDSINVFDFSRSEIYLSGYGQKYIGGAPFNELIRGETTPERFIDTEQFTAEDSWTMWVSRSK